VAELCHNHRQPSTNNGKTPGQICILTPDGELIEKRIVTERMRFAAVFGSRPRARILIEGLTESEWVARCLEELGQELLLPTQTTHRCTAPESSSQDGPQGREGPGRGLPQRALPASASNLRRASSPTWTIGGPRNAGADPDAVHLADPDFASA
jgi:hypothetical protein